MDKSIQHTVRYTELAHRRLAALCIRKHIRAARDAGGRPVSCPVEHRKAGGECTARPGPDRGHARTVRAQNLSADTGG